MGGLVRTRIAPQRSARHMQACRLNASKWRVFIFFCLSVWFPLRQVSRYHAQVNHAAGPGGPGEPQAPQPSPSPRGCSSIYYLQAPPPGAGASPASRSRPVMEEDRAAACDGHHRTSEAAHLMHSTFHELYTTWQPCTCTRSSSAHTCLLRHVVNTPEWRVDTPKQALSELEGGLQRFSAPG